MCLPWLTTNQSITKHLPLRLPFLALGIITRQGSAIIAPSSFMSARTVQDFNVFTDTYGRLTTNNGILPKPHSDAAKPHGQFDLPFNQHSAMGLKGFSKNGF